MRKIEYKKFVPLTIDQLVSFCERIKGLSYKDSMELSKSMNMSKTDIESLRHILGYSDGKKINHQPLEKRERIVEEYVNGEISINELARKNGVNYNAVRSLLEARNITIRSSAWTVRQTKFLENGIQRGKTATEIAEEMGKTRKSVIEKARRMGITFSKKV